MPVLGYKHLSLLEDNKYILYFGKIVLNVFGKVALNILNQSWRPAYSMWKKREQDW